MEGLRKNGSTPPRRPRRTTRMQRPSLALQNAAAARDSPKRRRTRTGEASSPGAPPIEAAPCSRTPRVGSGKGVAGTSAKLRPPGPRGTRLTPWSRWPRAGSKAGFAGVGADPSEGFPRPRAGSRAGVAKMGAYPLEGVPRPGSFRLVVGGIVSCCCLGGIVSGCCLWGPLGSGASALELGCARHGRMARWSSSGPRRRMMRGPAEWSAHLTALGPRAAAK